MYYIIQDPDNSNRMFILDGDTGHGGSEWVNTLSEAVEKFRNGHISPTHNAMVALKGNTYSYRVIGKFESLTTAQNDYPELFI